MDGEITLDTETRALRGVQVLVIAVIAALVVVLAKVADVALHIVPTLVSALIPLVLLLVVLALVIGRFVGSSPWAMFTSAGRAARGAASAGAGVIAGGVRSGARAGIRAGSSSGGLTTSIAVRRFRVKALTGEMVPCVLQGDLVGDEVRHGDYVLLQGRRTRDGHMRVRRVDLLQTPSGPVLAVVRTRSARRHSAALVANRICLLLGLVLAAAVVLAAVWTLE